jgi:hypothetical protein
MKEILLTSPNSLTPKKFRTTINTANIVIHAAGGTGVSQNCKIVAAALMSVGTTMAIVYPRSKQVSYAHEYAHRDDGLRGAVTKKMSTRKHDPSSQSRRTKVPPNSSPQRRFNKMRSVANKPPRPRHESRDLAGSVRDAQSDQAHESISQQSARRACNRENFAGSEEETGSLSCVRCLGWLMAVAGFF